MKLVDQIINALSSEKTKTVYRYVGADELALLKSNNSDCLGNIFNGEKLSNTHKYTEETKYIHFFDSNNLPQRVIASLPHASEFLCEFEIEKSVLTSYKGKGYYPPQGYDVPYTEVVEYAIPASEYNPEWFKGFTPIASYDMQNTQNVVTEYNLEQ